MVNAWKFAKRVIDPLLLITYAFFCVLMLGIVLQYIPAGTDTAFLGIKQDYISIPWYLPAFYVHVFTAILALPAGFTQFRKKLRKDHPRIHRMNGRIYVFMILFFGAPSGLVIGIYANGGIFSQIAFVLLAILWGWFTWQAYSKARKGLYRAHRIFMIRSFALTLSAITLRAWKYALVAAFHPHPMDVYRVVAWLGWTLNLAIAELIIYQIRRP